MYSSHVLRLFRIIHVISQTQAGGNCINSKSLSQNLKKFYVMTL
ncbi:hypothetical protein LEP1GSC204_3267 [Leptospira interrogans serovar Copenhageni str. M20]|nr:hypothetical protein LEP1GSC117_4205 [Leptospira interrogans serovar Icterohaemorrhagiae str. Verdun LP]EMO19527.1 hypothetical protein LEP1GSC167_3007 [Leptospira interrogans serovar Copenhageni str. HAI0188]EMY51803.1 hypothetical protein LEP1GSC204_3267 [Leptospira interrogans serovar Copenhageni str. M20]